MPCFHWPENVIISSLSLQGSFWWIQNSWQPFIFQHFECIIPLLSGLYHSWGSLICDEFVVLFVIEILFVFGFWQFNYGLSMHFFEFILLGVCWFSWMWRLIFFIKFGKFWNFVSPIYFSSLFTFWFSHNMYIGASTGVPQVSKALFFFATINQTN